MYHKGDQSIWAGRRDPGSVNELWHQVVDAIDLNSESPSSICFLGFCSDVGVTRNLGRPGAVNGPDAIRKAMVNFAVHFEDTRLTDGGNVIVSADKLEAAQGELGNFVQRLLSSNSFPILLGGGHEISFGHAKGILDFYKDKTVGVINIDPHFDLREYPQGAHSGSWARQLFDEYGDRFQYLPIGINPAVNIVSMFDLMRERNQAWISMDELLEQDHESLNSKIEYFIDSVDYLALTLDLDVFSAGIAPGVSAVNPYGALPHHIKPLMNTMLKSDKLVSFDVAEMNPVFDDGRTAKLATSFIYDVVERAL